MNRWETGVTEEQNELNRQQEGLEQEQGQEAMGYTPEPWEYANQEMASRDPMHWKRASDYYYRSRNGHQEALAGVTFEEVLRRSDPEDRFSRPTFRGGEGEEPRQEETERSQEAVENAGQSEASEDGELMGYSSDYYEWKMEQALEDGSQSAYDAARKNWAKAKVREST